MLVIAIDPSGNFTEGKGTTGICFGRDPGEVIGFTRVCAEDFKTVHGYYGAVLLTIQDIMKEHAEQGNVEFVIEDYRLYNHKGMSASTQANSLLETPRLIGILEWELQGKGKFPITKHMASDVKTRWSDSVLVHLDDMMKTGTRYKIRTTTGYHPCVIHERDALRHFKHYCKYTNKR